MNEENSSDFAKEEAITIVSDATKENVGKTINVVKGIAKNVKSKANIATTAARKTVAKKKIAKRVKVGFCVQYNGKEASKETILDRIQEEWEKTHKLSDIKTIEIYLKVEENTAYCMINGDIKIDIKLF
ncbi:DUF6465 family protein [Clostridium psychrophilum]|uniref:DUF6465 family protein n=1 Tax=Clostridium psychrophilum TaxID=132926 RepID=UPI001C0D6A0F|nr:DUF6465 family protein [Clostridium psychrophilum]MBU3179991.1 hypothetical protein [Clostridium psychrophilum]